MHARIHSLALPLTVANGGAEWGGGRARSDGFVARDPGAYLVHCGTPPVLMHLMQGMYLPITVDPKGGWPGKVDREFVLLQSEYYAAVPDSGDEHVRVFVVNAGPGETMAFHIVGTIFDRIYPDGDPAHALASVQTWNIPPGSGAVFETTSAKDGAGKHAFVTHAFADAQKGTIGTIEVRQSQ